MSEPTQTKAEKKNLSLAPKPQKQMDAMVADTEAATAQKKKADAGPKHYVGAIKSKIVDSAVLQSFNKIAFCGDFEPGYTIQIKAVVKEVYDAVQLSENRLQAQYKTLASLDDKGEPKLITVTDKNGNSQSKWDFTPENKLKADEAFKVSMAEEINLSNRPKLNFTKLHPARLSAVDLINLEWLIDETK